MVYETVNMKSDLCRFIYLYYYGGLYLDLDTTVDLPCLNNYLKDKRIFFEETPQKTIDIFTIYSAKPYDP
jgi:mannosyltransferase OCH1-like enzyme